MESKVIEVQTLLTEVAERLGILQLKLKGAEGEEYNRLMKIGREVRDIMEELLDIEDKDIFENKVKTAHQKSDNI